ncbi:MAG: LON peptidase substrate-binding domain-containing protein [Sphingobacteriales bacterium]|nr:MAG: LON peptidase substrate-binding domain-containing protein [Sphingobacteriales bacterium]
MESKFLPLFPLNIVAYPGEQIKLHIFEPRYRQLITEAVVKQTTFGIPTHIHKKVGNFGTEVWVSSVSNYFPEGEMDIVAEGLNVFELKQFNPLVEGKLYSGGEVVLPDNPDNGQIIDELKIQNLIEQLYKALNIKKTFDNYKSYNIAHHIGFSMDQEYALLQILNEYERQQFILAHLQELVPRVIEIERLKLKVQMNGYFKNFKPLDL